MHSDPATQRFTITIVAEPDDIDELDHVSNLVYLRWALDAARAHTDARGWDHAAYRRLGATWVVRRHEIDYLSATKLGETITVTTWIDSRKRASCVRRTDLVASDGRVLACLATTWAFVDLATGRPTRIPDEVSVMF